MLSGLGDATPGGIRRAVPVRPTRGPVQWALLSLPACPLALRRATRVRALDDRQGRHLGREEHRRAGPRWSAWAAAVGCVVGFVCGLADRGEVFGKTGTAEFGANTPPDAHGWFLGYRLGGPQGDLAFAVLVETGQSSRVAVDVTDAFLGGLG